MPIRKRYQFDEVEGVKIGRFELGLTSTFVLYRIGETLIDSGPSNQWREAQSFVAESPPTQLLLTHHHEDHSGNAARIAQQYSLTPYAPELGREKLAAGFYIPPMQWLVWGKSQPVTTQSLPQTMTLANGLQLVVIHTPGHADDLHCFFLPEKGWLFTADLYIARRLKYFRADEKLGQLIASLNKVLTYDFTVLFCAHRGIFEDGKQRLSEKRDNLLEFCQQVQDLDGQGVEVDEIVLRLLGKEGWVAKLTSYNVSKRNLVAEALKVTLG
ncbi:MAG: MBL fold metallo-hydrolase [Chloroflexota bacterium]